MPEGCVRKSYVVSIDQNRARAVKIDLFVLNFANAIRGLEIEDTCLKDVY